MLDNNAGCVRGLEEGSQKKHNVNNNLNLKSHQPNFRRQCQLINNEDDSHDPRAALQRHQTTSCFNVRHRLTQKLHVVHLINDETDC